MRSFGSLLAPPVEPDTGSSWRAPAYLRRQADSNVAADNRAGGVSKINFADLLSIVAQACATAAFAGSPPGIVAESPFSMKEPCCQELTFFNAMRFEAASALC